MDFTTALNPTRIGLQLLEQACQKKLLLRPENRARITIKYVTEYQFIFRDSPVIYRNPQTGHGTEHKVVVHDDNKITQTETDESSRHADGGGQRPEPLVASVRST
jgi:hypothetical protein